MHEFSVCIALMEQVMRVQDEFRLMQQLASEKSIAE